jgi:outer membrane receptor protein involved in Fe transport
MEASHPARLCRRASTYIKPADSRYDRGISGGQVTPLTGISLDGNQKGTSYAAFGQITVPLGEKTRLTGGLRYNTEHRTLDVLESLSILGLPAPIDLPFTDGATFNKLTFRLALDHKIMPDILAYASFNRGFKSGGFNILTPDEPDYEPETLDAYEVGLKIELFGRKFRINPSFFLYQYDNLQLPFFTASGQVGLANGPSAKLYGVDVDFEIAPSANVRLFGGASFIHDRFGTYTDAIVSTPVGNGAYVQSLGDATGNQLPFTSKFSGNVGVEYGIPTSVGTFTVSGNYSYNDGYFLEVDNGARQANFDQLSGSIEWTSDESRLSVSVWGKNLTNSEIYTQFATAPQGRGTSYQPPRTYGVTIGTKF